MSVRTSTASLSHKNINTFKVKKILLEESNLTNQIEQYIQIRDYLSGNVESLVETYLTGNWDPMVKFCLLKETNCLIKNLLKEKYPDFPCKYFPQVKFRIFEDKREIEAGIQTYFNKNIDLIFLGTADLDDLSFDFYIRKSADPSSEYTFFARYGHSIDNIYSGSKVAAAEYFMGTTTPLSVAFGLAVDDGFIA